MENPVHIHSSAAERLQPAATVSTALTPGATVYVPVYSSLYLGLDVKRKMVELAATVSVRTARVATPAFRSRAPDAS
jgi:hypothetical protein